MCNFANEITKSNIKNKLDKNLFSDPNSNYNILIEEMDIKHMPYKIVHSINTNRKNQLG